MLATYSAENLIAQEMLKYRMAALFLGELCTLYGIPASQTRLSQALRGAKALPNDVALQVRALVQEIAEYCDGSPAPVELVNAAQMKEILDARRKAKQFVQETVEEM